MYQYVNKFFLRHSKTVSKDFDMTRSRYYQIFDCREHSSHGLNLIQMNAYFSFCIKSTGQS